MDRVNYFKQRLMGLHGYGAVAGDIDVDIAFISGHDSGRSQCAFVHLSFAGGGA